MKLSNKIIDETISEVAGEDVLPLVKKLKNKKNVSEFVLADQIKVEINATRNMLYRLFDYNLVTFTRRKDKKKGWYIYYWTFNAKRVKFIVQDLKNNRLEKLKERLKREENGQFYICGEACIRLDFEQATDFEFKCPECGQLLNLEDNSKKIDMIQKEIKELEKEKKTKETTKKKKS